MNVKTLLRKSLAILLALSVILSVGVGAFAAPAKAETKATDLGNFGSTKTIYTGDNYYDDDFSIRLDAFHNSTSSTSSTGVPLDIAIVLDRSQSMSQPASTNASEYKAFKSYFYNGGTASSNVTTQISNIEKYLNTLNKDAYEGYYRATNYLKRGVPYFLNNHDGFAACGFASWEPLRYNKSTSKWEMRITNGYWGGDFPGGINTMDFTTGSILNKQVKWVPIADAYKEYCARNYRNINAGKQVKPGTVDTTGYTGYYDFVVATPRLSKAIDATETFIRDVYEHGKTLPAGQSHKISILSFGTGAFYVGGKYAYKQYVAATDSSKTIESTLKEELNVSKEITSLNTTANLNSVLGILRSHYTYTNTRTDWALDAVEKETKFLPDEATGRKQVVILITDGAPTATDNMEKAVADAALAAAFKLKEEEVEIYTIGFMPNLDTSKAPEAFINSNTAENQSINANSFLKSCSSMYPGAKAMGSFGSAATNNVPYYQADDGTGNKLAEIFNVMKEYILQTEYTGYFRDAKHLSIYDEITGEFKLDGARPIGVYAYPYQGNNTFGTAAKIADHTFTVPTEGKTTSVNGSGYNIQLTDVNGTIKVQLNWSDAKYAYLREDSYAPGGLYDAKYPKGYKIMLDVPIEVDRTETLGGNNIPTNHNKSGFYKPDATGSNTGVGDTIVSYPVPNVNVSFRITSEIYDYFMDLKDYAEKFQNPDLNGKDAEAVFQAMYQTIDELKALLSGDKNDYLHIDLELFNSLGQFLDGWHAEAGSDSFTNLGAENGATFDFMVDQILTFLITMTPKTNNYDSCVDANDGKGVEPYAPVSAEYHPNYYGPKFVVVDFDEAVKTPLDKEGGLNPAVTTTNGMIQGSSICYNFRENYSSGAKSYLEKTYDTVGYQVTAVNAPKSQKGEKLVARNFYVFPANVMTYDDTFLSMTSGTWETIGTYRDGEQSHNNSLTHGFDYVYNNTYSKDNYHDALQATTVSKTNGVAQATFTINGTGFDIFAQTGPNSGTMAVEVCSDEEFKNDAKTFIVDTYLKDATLNQIPVVRVDDLPYGTWYIRITAFYDAIFDHNYVSQWKSVGITEEALRERYDISADADFPFVPSESGYHRPATRIANASNGQYNIYIDGFRVYNTLGTTLGAMEEYAYKEAGEGVANIVNVNDALVDATNANAWADMTLENETASGVLYVAAGNTTSDQSSQTDGIILGMEGALYTKQDGSKFYVYKNAACTENIKYNGNNVYYRKQSLTSPYDRVYSGLNYYYDGGSASKPMTMAQVKEAFGSMPTYYNAKYSQYGPEKEVYLNGYNGVAFKIGKGATKVMVSLKSHNGKPAYVQFYDHSVKKFKTVATTTSRVEMYYDVTKYVSADGYVYIRNANPVLPETGARADGIAAICNIKYIGNLSKGITVDAQLIRNAQQIFRNAELPMDETVEIKHSLDLASDISLNYVVPTAKLGDYDYSYMEVTFKGETFVIEPEIRGAFGYFTVDGITAVDMTEELTATLHMFLGEEEFISETDNYCVADYAYTQLNKTDVSDELKAVCANLLRYGAMAQSFKGSENAPADAAMTAEQKAYVTDLNTVTVASAAKALGDVENGIAWAGKALVLDSKVAVKAVFNLENYAGNREALNLRVTYTNAQGEEVTLVIDTMEVYSGEYYAFVIDTLLATEMRSELSMALYEGDVQVSETQIYSVESYCVGKTGALADLGKALLAYSDAAKAFFAN